MAKKRSPYIITYLLFTLACYTVCNCDEEKRTRRKPEESLERRSALCLLKRCHVQGSEAAEKLWIGGCACLRFVVSRVGIIAAVGDACSSEDGLRLADT